MKHNFHFKYSSKGSALITVVAVAAIVMSMIALSTAKISQASLNSLNSSKTTLQAQQYAAAEATLLEAAAYENLTEHGREEIDNSGYDSEVTLSAESIYEDDIMQRTATINIYYGNEALPRYTLKKLLLSAKAGSSLPIGTIMPWASTSNPDDGTWLECNGQSCSAYPELVAVLGRATVPDYRGVFLRGYGSRTSSHYGTVTHQSGALGELQGDAIRNMTGNVATSMSYADGKLFVMGSTLRTFNRDGGGPVNATSFDTSRVVPTANENRPLNVAVRYLIKAA